MEELGTFAEDLKVACSERLEEKISEVSLLLSECFDYEKILIALEGTLKTEASSPMNCLKDKKGFLKLRKKEYCTWFRYVTMLPHVQENAERYVRMEEDCAEAVFHSFKEVVCELFWGSLRKYGISCLIVAKKPLTQHSEAIVEGFYSAMAIQKQRCHRSNRMIELRSKIDWLVPYVGCNTDKLVDGIAKLYLEKHTSPLLKDPRSISSYFKRNQKSKVVHRMKNAAVKYDYSL